MMRSKYLPAGIAVLGALLLCGMPVKAADEPAAHEARISELEEKVRRLEELIERQTEAFDQSCARQISPHAVGVALGDEGDLELRVRRVVLRPGAWQDAREKEYHECDG